MTESETTAEDDTREALNEALEGIATLAESLLKPTRVVQEAERKEFTLREVAEWADLVISSKSTLAKIEAAMLVALERERYKEEFVPLPNDGAMELGYNAGGRKWNHDRIKTVLIEAIISEHTDEKSGTLEAPVSQLIREAFDAAGISYWKTSELDRFDMDANDYSTKKPRKFKAKVHRGD